MKKFKYLLLAIMAVVLCSCSASIDDVIEDIKGEIETNLEQSYDTDVDVIDVTLAHVDGNQYTGIAKVRVYGNIVDYSLNVTFDGETYVWELYQ